MIYSDKNINDDSDEECDEENGEYEDELDLTEEDIEEEEEDEESEDEDEDEAVEDDEDFVENNENVNPNAIKYKGAKIRFSLGGGNNKIVLKKPNQNKTKFQKLVDESIHQLNERAGSSVEAMKKYIMTKNPELDQKRLRSNLKRYIKACLEDGTMIQIKRSFKLTRTHELKKKTKQAKSKNENQGDKKKPEKEKKKPKKTEKTKEKKSTNNKEASQKTSKVTNKTTKRTKTKATEDAKAKPAKQPKLDKNGKLEEKAASSEGKKKTEKTKSKNKLGRKSVNLVVRPNPPRPKSMKKLKSTTVAGKKENDSPENEDTDSKPASNDNKSTGKGKKK